MIEIGSSDAPVILGVSSFSTPWRLWAEKVGLIKREDKPDEVMKSGKRLEDYVLDMELEEEGIDRFGVDRQETHHHDSRGWQRATPDGVRWYHGIDMARDLFEVKCLVGQPPPSPRVADVVQCLHQLLVFEDADSNRLIYFGGLRRERFIIPRHQGALDRVLRAEEEFLELVEKEIPPPVCAEDSPGLWRGWPLARDVWRALPVESSDWAREEVEARADREAAHLRYEASRAKIKAAMGDAMYGATPSGVTFTWRPDKNGVRALKRKERGVTNGEEKEGRNGAQ